MTRRRSKNSRPGPHDTQTRAAKPLRKRLGQYAATAAICAAAAIMLSTIVWHIIDGLFAEIVVFAPSGTQVDRRWLEHLREAGFWVQVVDDVDPEYLRRSMRAPEQFARDPIALTIKPGRYMICGPVPADIIVRLLTERPAIGGLALYEGVEPPLGNEDVGDATYDVWAFSADGATSVVYLHREPAGAR